MIQLGMLVVVQEFQVGNEWVFILMIVYLVGGMFLQWLLGLLLDCIGCCLVMLIGVVWFIVICLVMLLVQIIEQFILLCFLQGISLCFIGVVGYVVIQEFFEEVVCIKIIVLMVNVVLIVLLLGLLVGVVWVYVLLWEMMFVLFVVLVVILFFGLQWVMLEIVMWLGEKLLVKELGCDYWLVLKNLCFVVGVLVIGFVSLLLLVWIVQLLVIIISGEQVISYEYGMLQVLIFGVLIVGNLVLVCLIVCWIVCLLIIMGGWLIMFGLIFFVVVIVVFFYVYLWMMVGLSFYVFGIGFVNVGLVCLILFVSEMSKGMVLVVMGMLQMLIFIVGIEFSKYVYELGGNGLFSLFNLLGGVLWLGLMIYFLKDKSVGNLQQGQLFLIWMCLYLGFIR